MSGNMTKPVSFRVTEEEYDQISEASRMAGCSSVSEFVRRRSLEDISGGMRDAILLIRELALSSVAHLNVQCDTMGIKADDRGRLVDQYKIAILDVWNSRNGIVEC